MVCLHACVCEGVCVCYLYTDCGQMQCLVINKLVCADLQNDHCILHAQLIRWQTLRLPDKLLTLCTQESVQVVHAYYLCNHTASKITKCINRKHKELQTDTQKPLLMNIFSVNLNQPVNILSLFVLDVWMHPLKTVQNFSYLLLYPADDDLNTTD